MQNFRTPRQPLSGRKVTVGEERMKERGKYQKYRPTEVAQAHFALVNYIEDSIETAKNVDYDKPKYMYCSNELNINQPSQSFKCINSYFQLKLI